MHDEDQINACKEQATSFSGIGRGKGQGVRLREKMKEK